MSTMWIGREGEKMPTFRTRPLEVQAVQYIAESHLPEGVIVNPRQHDEPFVSTLEGDQLVRDGDWIITGVKGEKYPCREGVFRATYEPVDGEADFALIAHMTRDAHGKLLVYGTPGDDKE